MEAALIASIPQLISILDKYGPDAVNGIIALFKKGSTATVADVESAFSGLKPYASYGIPDIAPTAPVPPIAP